MPRNKIIDLNNHLFAQLERLGEEDLTPEQLETEIKRAKSISDVSKQIVSASKLSLDAMKFVAKGDATIDDLPTQLKLDK